jgi:predicted porin
VQHTLLPNRTDDQKLRSNERGDKADAWTVGAKYDANNVYLAAMYAETRNMTPSAAATSAQPVMLLPIAAASPAKLRTSK